MYAQEPKCTDFKTGYFKLVDSTGTVQQVMYRTEKIQTEYHRVLQRQAIYDVNWINDCLYTLKDNDTTALYNDLLLKIEILEIKENAYTARVSSEGYDLVQTTKIIKIEESEYHEILARFQQDVKAMDKFKNILQLEVCNCFVDLGEDFDFNDKILTDCFTKGLMKHEQEFSEVFVQHPEIAGKYGEGEELGIKLVVDIQPYLIQNCEPYYMALNNLKKTGFDLVKKQAPKNQIDSLSTLIDKSPSSRLYLERASQYLSMGAYENVAKDIALIEALPEKSPNLISLKAVYYDMSEQYDKAADCYAEIFEKTGKFEMLMMAELAKRNALEQKKLKID